MQMNYGFHERMPFREYKAIPALNYSSLKHMKRSPLSYRFHVDNPGEPTDAMLLGTACHTAMLEPDQAGDFAVWTEGRRFGRKWDEFCDEHLDKQILTTAEYASVVGMSVAIRRSPLAMRYLRQGRSEVSMVWRDKASGRDCKGRIDKLPEGQDIIVDLKTCRDATVYRFGAEAYRLGYHLQLAMYADGYYALTDVLPGMVEIAVENRPPHEIVVYRVPNDVLQQGTEDYTRLIQRLVECEQSGIWPPACEEEEELSLPTYAFSQDGDDLSDLELIA